MPDARRVLILDDDPMVGLLMETVARLDGAAVRLTAAADEFFISLETWLPTHVVLDLTLTDRTGEQVLQVLADGACRARIVIVSGADPARLTAAAAAGRAGGLNIAGGLHKPFMPATLRGLLV